MKTDRKQDYETQLINYKREASKQQDKLRKMIDGGEALLVELAMRSKDPLKHKLLQPDYEANLLDLDSAD